MVHGLMRLGRVWLLVVVVECDLFTKIDVVIDEINHE